MICITRTPLRVSLFGGGTDYPGYFQRRPGAVLGFAINKYIYVSVLKLGAYVDYRYRLSYSKVEHVEHIEDIEHPVVREAMKYYGWDEPADFSFQSDLPASAGLGSSSAFTVGFISALSHLMNMPRTPMELARHAIHIEQVLLNEKVGVQDQMHAAFGGIHRFDFHGDDFRATPIAIDGQNLSRLTDSMVLVFTGIKRRAANVLAEQVQNTNEKKLDEDLSRMLTLVEKAQAVLECRDQSDEMPIRVGEMLDESWRIKKRFSSGVSGSEIDKLYEFCRRHGAIGGKLCGAGGGGFLLMVVPQAKITTFRETVGPRRCVSFCVDLHGSRVVSEGLVES
jgi:D-glycero-alpha-D-manno-heptose-7-phosphate kinase